MGAIPILSDAELTVYAAKAGASSADWTMGECIKRLRTLRMLYFKQSPGDCPAPVAGGGSALASGARITSMGLGATSSIVGMSSIAAGTFTAVLGGATMGAGLLLAPILMITAHHAAAVRTEQSTLCAITSAYNQFADQAEAALSSGKLSVADASAALDQAAAQLDTMFMSIPGVAAGKHDAGWGYQIVMHALVLYNKAVIYPALAPSGIAGLSGNSGLLVVGGGLVAAKVGGLL